jgi:hypothetical protein
MGVIIVVILLIFILLVILFINNSNRKLKLEKEISNKGLVISNVKDILTPDNNAYIALDSKKEFILYVNAQVSSELKIIPLKDIKSVELNKDGETVYEKKLGTTIKRAIVGGVVLGGLGAVIGAITGSQEKIEKINRVSIVTSGNSGANTYLYFVNNVTPNSLKKKNLQLAEKWIRIIENYIDNN